MTYNEILPLVRREPFVPLRVMLNDGRSFELRQFGQFMLVPRELTVRIPYELPATPMPIQQVKIQYSEIKEVIELADTQRKPNNGSGHGPPDGKKQPMTALELKTLLARRPFVPIQLIMNDGRTHEVLMARTFLVLKDWLELGQPDPELPPPAVRNVKSIPIADIENVIDMTPAGVVGDNADAS
jgi:hypothetical protein